MFYKGEDFSMV